MRATAGVRAKVKGSAGKYALLGKVYPEAVVAFE
jgi:hypothetical protein